MLLDSSETGFLNIMCIPVSRLYLCGTPVLYPCIPSPQTPVCPPVSGLRADNAIRRHPDIAHDPRASARAAGTNGAPVRAAHGVPDDTPILGHLAQIIVEATGAVAEMHGMSDST